MLIPDPKSRITDPGSLFFPTRIQGSKKHRILDTQHYFIFTAGKLYTVRYVPYCHIIYLNNSIVFLWFNISLKIFLRKSVEISWIREAAKWAQRKHIVRKSRTRRLKLLVTDVSAVYSLMRTQEFEKLSLSCSTSNYSPVCLILSTLFINAEISHGFFLFDTVPYPLRFFFSRFYHLSHVEHSLHYSEIEYLYPQIIFFFLLCLFNTVLTTVYPSSLQSQWCCPLVLP